MLIDRTYDNIRLTTFVRNVVQRPADVLTLERFLPPVPVNTRTFKVRSITKTNRMAPYRTFDTPSPIRARAGFTEKTGTLPPISQASILGEDEILSVYERIIAGDWNEEIRQHVNNDAADNAEDIWNRMEYARMECLLTGTFSFESNIDGMIEEVDFGRPNGNALNASATWATASNSIITDVRTLNEASLDDHGVPLDFLLVGSETIQRMVTNTEIRTMLGAGTGQVPGLVTQSAVASLFRSLELPAPITYTYKINGTKLLTDDYVIGLPADQRALGRTEMGTTAEALELPGIQSIGAPGMVAHVMTNEHPVQKLTNVVALGMPVPGDPSRIYTMNTTP